MEARWAVKEATRQQAALQSVLEAKEAAHKRPTLVVVQTAGNRLREEAPAIAAQQQARVAKNDTYAEVGGSADGYVCHDKRDGRLPSPQAEVTAELV
jgi:hypothetical protein